MEHESGLLLVEEYLERIQEESRVAAAERYLAADADISINSTPLTVPEYMQRMRNSDRHFAITNIDVLDTVVEDDTVAVRIDIEFELGQTTYGIEPGGEELVDCLMAVHEIQDDELVALHIVYDQTSTLEDLGLLSSDPTTEKLRDQYYDVLNRVLRHNLRNNLNVIQVRADSLRGDEDFDPDAIASQIDEATAALLETVEKARRLERLAIEAPLDPERVDVSTALDAVIEWYDIHSGGRFETDYSDAISQISTDRQLLVNLVSEVVENAIQHDDATTPAVTVSTRDLPESRYAVAVDISDNGPGIPDCELRPLREAEETELLHGSGIGLWIVKWCVTRLDGDLTFADEDGTRVQIKLPDL